MQPRTKLIREFILSSVEDAEDIVGEAAKRFGISRPAVTKHLRRMVDDGLLEARGATRSRTWRRAGHWAAVELGAAVEEDVVWREHVAPHLPAETSKQAKRILNYAFTEMMNNAIEHSGSDRVTVYVFVGEDGSLHVSIQDHGVGIFQKLKDAKALEDERHALLELAKGKLTTDPSRHSGEGVFFTSRAVDKFFLSSHELTYSSGHEFDMEFLTQAQPDDYVDGTTVDLMVHMRTTRELKDVFDEYAADEEKITFSRTVVPVRLAAYEGSSLVSRSQARRLLARIESFRVAMFDFSGVDEIGQAFADELFRVFASEHPEVDLHAINANDDVMRMIRRAIERARDGA